VHRRTKIDLGLSDLLGIPNCCAIAGQEGDDGYVHGGPAGGRQRVREQSAHRREPDHEQEPRDGHGVRGGRRGEADGARGGTGGGGRLALRLSPERGGSGGSAP
jgi:hypothetical protein